MTEEFYRPDEYSEMELRSIWINLYCEATDTEPGSWKRKWLVSCAVQIEKRLFEEWGFVDNDILKEMEDV